MNSIADAPPPYRRRRWTLLLRLLAGGAILAVMLTAQPLDWSVLGATLRRAEPALVAVAALGMLATMGLKTRRWMLLVRRAGRPYPFGPAYRAYLAAFALGIVTPGRLGEFARAATLRREVGIPWGASLRTVVSDRLFDMVFLAALGPFALWAVLRQDLPAVLLGIGALTLGVGLTRGLASVGPRIARGRTDGRRFGEVLRWLDAVSADFAGPLGWVACALTAASYAVFFGAAWALFRAVGLDLDFREAACVTVCLNLIVLLPISIAGIGTREAGLVFLLGFYGVARETALAASVLQFIVFTGLGGLAGVIALAAGPPQDRPLPADGSSEALRDASSTPIHPPRMP